MTTYYVDGTSGLDTNSGLSGFPVKTIPKGISKATAPDDVIEVANGNYDGSIFSSTFANGTAGHPITLRSTNLYGAKIKVIGTQNTGTTHAAPGACAIEIQGDYWIMERFEVDGSAGYSGDTWIGSGPQWDIGIYLTGSFSIARNNKVHDLAKSSASTTNGGGGIVTEYYYPSPAHSGQGQEVRNNLVYRCGSQLARNNTVHGIYHTSPNAKSINNLVHSCSSTAVTSWHLAANLEIANNTGFNCKQGITVGNDGTVTTNNGTRCYNNIMAHCDTTGIDEEGTTGANNLYNNNQCYANGTNISLLTGTAVNTLTSDPLFVNYQADGSGDYGLQSGSPCKDSGTNSIATAPAVTAPTTDYNGNARPFNTTTDRGAFEYFTVTVALAGLIGTGFVGSLAVVNPVVVVALSGLSATGALGTMTPSTITTPTVLPPVVAAPLVYTVPTTKTFVQLVNRLKSECGVSGADIVTVFNQSTEINRLINWINEAWIEIQSKHEDWAWMRASASFVTADGKATYDPIVDCKVNDLGKWARNSFRNYDTLVGFRSEIYMDYLPYEQWRNQYQYGNMRFTSTRPIEMTITPNFSIGLGPVPVAGYTIIGDYFRVPTELVADADVPGLPIQFQLAIIYRAMMSYGAYEAASEVYQRGSDSYAGIMGRMEISRLPEMSAGSTLA